MTAAASSELEGLAENIAGRLQQAVETRRGAWRTPVLATVSADGPSARVVVVRTIEPAQRRLEIFTDAGSAKVAEIAADPRVALTFWDPDAQEQLRMAGRARAQTDAAILDARWQAIGPTGQVLYGGEQSRMLVLEVVWTAWDWLWIGGAPHRRASFTWTPDGLRDATWVAP